jgi:hypothetical protein
MLPKRVFTTPTSRKTPAIQGRYAKVVVRKKGQLRGRGSEKKLYGNDVVELTFLSCFAYDKLVERSLQYSFELSLKVLLLEAPASVRDTLSIDIFAEAMQELRGSWRKRLSFVDQIVPALPKASSRGEPIYKGFEKIPGAYRYENRIYFQGIKIREEILEKAPNGPSPRSLSPKALAKELICERLPISRFVSSSSAVQPEW